MGLVGRLNQHFNPWNITVQLKEDSGARDCMGLAGSALMATAAIGYLFFGASIQTCGCLGVTGACFFASYWTGKDGYAWLVGVVVSIVEVGLIEDDALTVLPLVMLTVHHDTRVLMVRRHQAERVTQGERERIMMPVDGLTRIEAGEQSHAHVRYRIDQRHGLGRQFVSGRDIVVEGLEVETRPAVIFIETARRQIVLHGDETVLVQRRRLVADVFPVLLEHLELGEMTDIEPVRIGYFR